MYINPVQNTKIRVNDFSAPNPHTQITMSSAAAQFPDATPNPPVFKPKNNPAFILHGKLSTSFEEVGPDGIMDRADEVAASAGDWPG